MMRKHALWTSKLRFSISASRANMQTLLLRRACLQEV